jgi:alpha-D-xyloside xylohydrolase
LEWNESRQTLTIGKRSGEFPGMLKERNFHVVFVSPGHGTATGVEAQADAVVRYIGKAVAVRAKK